MKGYRIDFLLATALRVPEFPLHLDSVLAWAAVQEGLEKGLEINEAQELLPLAREGQGDTAVWKASWVEFGPGARDSFVITRPFRLNEVVEDMGQVFSEVRRQKWDGEIASSPNKAYFITVPTRHVKKAQAWFVGDKEGVELLLQRVTHLGKLSRLDCGRIHCFTVTEDATALDRWKRRVITWPEPGYRRTIETTKPPYFRRDLRREAWVPSAARPPVLTLG